MASLRSVRILTSTVLLSPSAAAFSLNLCYQQIESLASKNQSFVNDSTIFFQTPANLSNPVLTLFGCESICGSADNSIYSDCGPRLFQWVLPVIILIGSLQIPPLTSRQRLWIILRAIGDPIDALLSMIYKLYLCEQCCDEAQKLAENMIPHLPKEEDNIGEKFLARLFALTLYEIVNIQPEMSIVQVGKYVQDAIATAAEVTKHTHPPTDDGIPVPNPLLELKALLLKTAGTIMQIRSRSMLKPYNAIIWFILGALVAIIPEVAQSVPSGGMIASLLVLSPLLIMIFLSNAIGECTSGPLLLQTVKDFLDGLAKQDYKEPLPYRNEIQEAREKLLDPKFPQSLLYVTGFSLYQPLKFSKARLHVERLWNYVRLLILLLVFPLAITAAGIGLGTPPTYFNDRHIVLIIIFISWVVSAWFTSLVTSKYGDLEGTSNASSLRQVWLKIAIKDVIIAIAIPIFLSGMTCGWLGGCKMWSGYYRYGQQNARIPLNPQDAFYRNGHVVYPVLISLCLGLNILSFFGVRYVFRKAFTLLVWSDEEKERTLRGGQ